MIESPRAAIEVGTGNGVVDVTAADGAATPATSASEATLAQNRRACMTTSSFGYRQP